MFVLATESGVLYLTVANIVLGVVALVCVLIVVGSALREIMWRIRGRDTFPAPFDKHGFVIPGLGTTIDDRRQASDSEPSSGSPQPAPADRSARGRSAA